MSSIFNALVAFASLMAVFYMLEKLFTFHKQPVIRKEWFTDVLFFSGQYLVWEALIVTMLVTLTATLSPLVEPIQNIIKSQAFWIQIIEVVILGDLLVYWGHRLSHKVEFLWQFHCIHHTTEELD